MKRRGLLDALAAAVAATTLPWPAHALSIARPQAEVQRLQAHLRFLADPLLEGREAGTCGYDIAAAYVASQFAQLGLKPLPGGGYTQPVTIRTGRIASTAPVLELCRGDRCERLAWMDEFLARPDLTAPHADVKAPLVFVGYGVVAPRFGMDDYAGLDVKDSIVVVLSGRPPQMPPEEGAHFGNGRTKAELAASRGAVGFISLSTPRSEIAAPFHAGRQYVDATYMDWLTPEGRVNGDIPGLRGSASVSVQAAPKLLAHVTRDYAQLVADAEAGRSLPRGPLRLEARLVRDSTHGQVRSHNVVGLIEGQDPMLKHEHIVLTAHLDHLGRKPGPKGDVIYPGAMDNAMGVAVLLEAARLLSSSPAPSRSIIVIALTGEEKGLLGSSYFTRNPSVPLASLVAAVNIDMPILLHDFKEIVDIGGEHSTLGQAVERAAQSLGVKRVGDPQPEQNRFTRSDQYSFVRAGIPAVIVSPGGASFDKGVDGNALIREFRRLHYHQPSDDLSQPFHWGAAQLFTELQRELVLQIAREPERPRWLPGDFFGELFGRR